jgi:hypothetical protein
MLEDEKWSSYFKNFVFPYGFMDLKNMINALLDMALEDDNEFFA